MPSIEILKMAANYELVPLSRTVVGCTSVSNILGIARLQHHRAEWVQFRTNNGALVFERILNQQLDERLAHFQVLITTLGWDDRTHSIFRKQLENGINLTMKSCPLMVREPSHISFMQMQM
jgi:hypothetical protein